MGDGLSRAFELAVTPVLFGALGYALDRWIGVLPVFTIVFVLVALIGMMLRTWYGYVYRMQALEEAGPWAKRT
jgi:F0F1-type ATP synthase assembly protein I